jgi:hypothetical protein
MSAQVDPELARQLDFGDPEAWFEAIVTAEDGLDALLDQLPAEVEVEHRYSLIDGVAVKAQARALRTLATMSVVKSIEPVRSVKGC